MKKPITSILLLAILCPSLMSCASKQGSGAVIGGITGGLVGSRFGKGGGSLLATGLGAMAGAAVGSTIGKNMDDQDRRMMAQTSRQALETTPSGQSIEWKNPDSGHYGYIKPVKTFKQSGRYCREYQKTIVIGGKTENAYGTACRQPDGNWQIVEE